MADTKSTATTYSHGSLAPATTRHYRVSAITPGGTSDPSSAASATTAAAGKPTAPTGLTATAGGKRRIDLAWNAPLVAAADAPTHYGISIADSPDTTDWNDAGVISAGRTTHTYTEGLSPGTTKYFRVYALASGDRISEPSNVAGATTLGADAITVEDPTATAVGPTRIEITWTVSLAPTTNATVVGAEIEVSDDGAGGPWSVLETKTSPPYSHTGLDPETTRHYRVSRLHAGDGSTIDDVKSNVAGASTGAATTPGAPTGLTASAYGDTRQGISGVADSGAVAEIAPGLPRRASRCPTARSSNQILVSYLSRTWSKRGRRRPVP